MRSTNQGKSIVINDRNIQEEFSDFVLASNSQNIAKIAKQTKNFWRTCFVYFTHQDSQVNDKNSFIGRVTVVTLE